MISPEWTSDPRPVSAAGQYAIDAECDRFEAAWMAGQPEEIGDVLSVWHGLEEFADRQALLRELVLLDLEYRWQSTSIPLSDRDGIPHSPRVEDYLVRYPDLRKPGSWQLDLVTTEYRVRQQWGDRPTFLDYRKRFPHLGPELEQTLRQVALDLSPAMVKIYYNRRLVFRIVLRSPLEIGRQKQGEPAPYCDIDENGMDRLVIAPLQNKTVSRSHLYLDVVARNQLNVVNRSSKLGLYINHGSDRLCPGGSRYVNWPLLLFVGKTAIRVDAAPVHVK